MGVFYKYFGENDCVLEVQLHCVMFKHSSKHGSKLHQPQIFYPSGHWCETVTNVHVSVHYRQSLGASVISTNIRTEGLYDKTTIIYQLKRLCVPDCAYTENMFINSIHISPCMIYLSRRIFYIKLKETWLYERDSDAPSVISEPGGK